MPRKVFYSFHYKPDHFRVSQVRNIGAIEDNKPASDNDWESVCSGKDAAIKRWIDDQMQNRTCTIVMIGSETAGRKWIKYEIEKSWQDKKGLIGIHIHNLKHSDQKQSVKGGNPFAEYKLNGTPLTSIVKSYDPPFSESKAVYGYIADNLEKWIEEAIRIRGNHS